MLLVLSVAAAACAAGYACVPCQAAHRLLSCHHHPCSATEYVHACAHDMEEAADVRDLAAKTWQAMKRTAKAGQRRTLPDMQVRGRWGRCGGTSGLVAG